MGERYRFVTLVLDLDSGAVVFVGEGKGAECRTLLETAESCPREGSAVATDMSPAYIGAVIQNLPEAQLVFDRFHVMKLLNEKLTELRCCCSARRKFS